MIVEWPPESCKWYILRCDEHMVHFGLKPLLGAAKHLASVQHNHLPKHHSLAVDLLGQLVWDCDSELAAKNNAVVQRAFDKEGYTPFNINRLSKQERISQGFVAHESPSMPKSGGEIDSSPSLTPSTQQKTGGEIDPSPHRGGHRPFNGITNPVPGELYLGYWSKTRTRYAIMVFPFWGDISMTGLHGTLASVGLVSNAPKCVRVSRSTQEILGWHKGYEDGGPLVTKREFPVVYFDRKQ